MNRVEELKKVTSFLNQSDMGSRVKVISASPRSGLSFFLQHCAQLQANKNLALYVDGSNHVGNSIFSQILVGLYNIYPDIWNKFNKFKENKIGNKASRDITLAAMTCIPYVGTGLSQAVRSYYPTFPVSAYPSLAAEIICEFIVNISRVKRVVIIIDNVQELDDWSNNLLTTTVGRAYENLKYVAGFSQKKENAGTNASDFVMQISDFGYKVNLDNFALPGEHFIFAYARACNLKLNITQVKAIAAAARGDIYRIRAALIEASQSNESPIYIPTQLSPISSFLLCLLAVAKQNLRKSDLIVLVMQNDTVFAPDELSIISEIELLADQGVVSKSSLPDGDELISLIPSGAVIIESINIGDSEQVRVASILYSFYTRVQEISVRHSLAETAPLLFRLAKIVDKENLGEKLSDIIKYSLQMGSQSAAEEFVNRAVNTENIGYYDINDFLAKLAFFVSIKKYDQVLKLLGDKKNKQWADNRLCRIFKGIALNRERRHSESEALLAKLCNSFKTLEELSILVSFRIVGFIHDNNLAAAKKLYNDYRNKLTKALNFGYFLRNSAEVFPYKEAVDLLSEALEHHIKRKDQFGQATTLCNRGTKLVHVGLPAEGLKDVIAAQQILEVFGIHHLGIVTGDTGHCQLYLGKFKEAEKSFVNAMRYMGIDLPKVYSMINLAVAQLFQNQKKNAINTIEKATLLAAEIKVDRAQQKAYFNGALVHLWAGSPKEVVYSYCNNSLKHLGRRGTYITENKILLIKEMIGKRRDISKKLFFDIYSPCGLLYWYQNPLEGITSNVLSTKTIH